MSSLDPRTAIVAATLLAAGAPAAHVHHAHAGQVRHHVRHDQRAVAHRRRHPARPRRGHTANAHATRDPAVSIVDFRFAPPSTTVHVGDTVTWTNTGTQPHTATAYSNSFNTGVLSHGQSASHTFTTPGTFTYFCQVHPFMHGTIVVLASTTTTAPAPSRSATPSAHAAARSPAATTAGPTLPFTGLNVAAAGAIGALLMGAGVLIRALTRAAARVTE